MAWPAPIWPIHNVVWCSNIAMNISEASCVFSYSLRGPNNFNNEIAPWILYLSVCVYSGQTLLSERLFSSMQIQEFHGARRTYSISRVFSWYSNKNTYRPWIGGFQVHIRIINMRAKIVMIEVDSYKQCFPNESNYSFGLHAIYMHHTHCKMRKSIAQCIFATAAVHQHSTCILMGVGNMAYSY